MPLLRYLSRLRQSSYIRYASFAATRVSCIANKNNYLSARDESDSSPYSEYGSQKYFLASRTVLETKHLRTLKIASKNGYLGILLFSFLIFPFTGNAAIIINEVAWMGDSDSANNEWIELYNTDSNLVSVDNWQLTDGAGIDITLSGTVGGNDYAVLERTNDDSAPGGAFLIYTGALSNSGSTLELTRDDGGLEDRVSGGNNWETIGGDNTTKETAQYTTSGWVTADATPGKTNATEDSTEQDEGDKDNQSGSGSSGFSSGTVIPKTKLGSPDTELELIIEAPSVGYVNQPIAFNSNATGIGKTLIESLKYQWNFGDFTTASGREQEHIFAYPGEYVVHLEAAYARHHTVARHEITILPVTFSITRKDGVIHVHNDALYEIDVSGFKLIGHNGFEFPKYSVLLPRGSVAVPEDRVGMGNAFLFDQMNTIIASEMTQPVTETNKIAETPVSVARTVIAPSESQAIFASDTSETSLVSATSTKPETKPLNLEANVISATDESNTLPYIGLVGVLGVAFASILYGRSRKNEAADE